MDGALAALGRQTADGAAFARQFAQRVEAERDGASFVSSVERRMRTEAVAGALVRPRALRFLPLVLVPAALAAAALVLCWAAPGARAADRRWRPAPPRRWPRAVRSRLQPAPPRSAPERLAHLAEVGGITYLLSEAQRTPAARGSALPAGAGLVTVGAGSRAVVAFADRTRLTLEGDTVLAQLAGVRGGGAVAKAAFLSRGRLSAEVPAEPTGRPLLVTTPHAEVSTLGGKLAVYVDAASTRLDVEQGHASLARLGGGGPTVVGAAQYALVGERGDTLATPMSRGGAALLVAGTLNLSPADERVKKRLEAHGLRGAGAARAGRPGPRTSAARPHHRHLLDRVGARHERPLPRRRGAHHRVGTVFIRRPRHDRRRGPGGPGVRRLERRDARSRIPPTRWPPAATAPPPSSNPAVDASKLRQRRMSFGAPGPHAQVVAVWPGMPGRAMVFAYERGAPMPGLAGRARAAGGAVSPQLHRRGDGRDRLVDVRRRHRLVPAG